jgi:hypothetical protein
MRGDPPAGLEYLRAYYRGVFFATVALKGRLAKLDPSCREAVREVGRYQAMMKRFSEALEETRQLQDLGGPGAESGRGP